MAIISEYEDAHEDVEVIVRANLQDGEDGDEGEDEDYPPDPYSSSGPSEASNSERPYDEVLRYLLREHQQQPLDMLSTVIEFLFRETGIATQEGVDVQVSQMLSAAKRRRVDTDDTTEDVGGPDKIAKLEEMFDDSLAKEEEQCSRITIPESIQGSSPISESSYQQQNSFENEKAVKTIPAEYPQTNICEKYFENLDESKSILNAIDNDEHHYEAHTSIITPVEDVSLTSNLALEHGAAGAMHVEDEKVKAKDSKLTDLNPNNGNGADLENYSWTQTLYDATLLIPVPIGTNTKFIVCDIQPRYLKVGLKGHAPLLEGDLNKPVKPSECFWNLENGKLLAIHLQKHYTMDWWHVILEGEPEIDVTKVHLPYASLSDLHPNTRQHVEHAMFNHQQATKEIPSSDETRKNDILRKFNSEANAKILAISTRA